MTQAAKPEPITLRVKIESMIKGGKECHKVFLIRSDCPPDGQPSERHRMRVLETDSKPHALAIANQFTQFLDGVRPNGAPVLADYLGRARAMVIATASSVVDACTELKIAAIDEMDRMLADLVPDAGPDAIAAGLLGRPPVSDETWLVVDSSAFSNDRVWFWKRGRAGYTTDIAEAHYFTEAEAMACHQQREFDVPVRLADMQTMARQNVKSEDFQAWHHNQNAWVVVDVLASSDAHEGKTMKLWQGAGKRTRLLAEAAKMDGPAALEIARRSQRDFAIGETGRFTPGPDCAHQVKELQPLVDASGQIPWAAYMAKFGGGQ